MQQPIMLQEELLTIPQLRSRLNCSSEKAYDLAYHPDCPVVDIGGKKGLRIIWTQFIQWKQKGGGKHEAV